MLKQMVGQAFMTAVAGGSSDVAAATIQALKTIAAERGFDPERVVSMTLPTGR